MAQSHVLQIKRIYDSAQPTDGYRVLVDRVWPRGVSKERADLDRWAKTEVTPTADLRKWFAHDPAKFDEFKAAEFVSDVRDHLRTGNVTLLYAAKDPACNHAVILRDWIAEHL